MFGLKKNSAPSATDGTTTRANTTAPSAIDPSPRTADVHAARTRLTSAQIELDAANKAVKDAAAISARRTEAIRKASAEQDEAHRHWRRVPQDLDRRDAHEEAVQRHRDAQALPDPYPAARERIAAAAREVDDAKMDHEWKSFKERESELHHATSAEGFREKAAPAAKRFVDALKALESAAAEIETAWTEAHVAGKELSKFGRISPEFCERQKVGPIALELVERGGPTSGRPSGDELPYAKSLVELVKELRKALSVHTSGRVASTGEAREKDLQLLRRMFSARVPGHVLVQFDEERSARVEAERERAHEFSKAERARKQREAESAPLRPGDLRHHDSGPEAA